jgi:hypothetical protein
LGNTTGHRADERDVHHYGARGRKPVPFLTGLTYRAYRAFRAPFFGNCGRSPC